MLERPTLKSIAARVGVDPSTISRVINNKKRDGKYTVSPEKRKEIIDLCRKLGYRPNAMARAIRTNKSMTIGAVGRLKSPYFFNMILPAQQEAFRQGYTMTVHAIDDYDSPDKAMDDMISQWQYDGILTVGSLYSDLGAIVDGCSKHNLPLVMVGHPFHMGRPRNTKCVDVDFDSGAANLIDYLYGLGHRRYAIFICDMEKNELSQMYVEGFRRCTMEAGLLEKDVEFVDTSFDMKKAFVNAVEYFGRLKEGNLSSRPTAVISIGHTMGTLQALQEVGLSAPEDISFCTVDYSFENLSEQLHLPITAMYEAREEFGKKAVELLIGMINNEDERPFEYEHVMLPMALKKDHSCGAV
jgi:DNA-binding LacI/PurR family transcriptional regulator